MLEIPAIERAVRRISVDEYHRLTDVGIIPENTELVRGFILRRTAKSPLHTWIVQSLADALRAGLPPDYALRQEQPLTLADSEPEPDIAIVRGAASDYQRAHPSTAALVVEVAIASVEVDREKASVYAAAGVAEYWLVLPSSRRVDVYESPSPAGYRERRAAISPDRISPRALPAVSIDLAELFVDSEGP